MKDKNGVLAKLYLLMKRETLAYKNYLNVKESRNQNSNARNRVAKELTHLKFRKHFISKIPSVKLTHCNNLIKKKTALLKVKDDKLQKSNSKLEVAIKKFKLCSQETEKEIEALINSQEKRPKISFKFLREIIINKENNYIDEKV